jgi:hypothetical protein
MSGARVCATSCSKLFVSPREETVLVDTLMGGLSTRDELARRPP